jgi:uncharacterized protein (TIGR02271 family)
MTMGRGDYAWRDQLVANAEVFGADGEKIGHLAAADANVIQVQKGWLFIKDIYLPTSSIARVEADRVYLTYTKAEAEQMGREDLPTAGDAWYGTTATTTATGYNTNYDTTTNATAATGYGTDRTVREGENISVPVVEEQLKAGVRETEAGRARIVKNVTEERQTLDVPVEREEVYVTERSVDRPATAADLAMRDREIEIPLREQEAVVQKEARVTGEVNVRKEVVRDTERVSDTVRREDVHVEHPDDARVHTEGTRGMAGQTAETDSGTVSAAPTDTAYDRSGIAGDRYTTDPASDRGTLAGDRYTTTDTDMTSATGRDDEGIIDRAKDKVRERNDRMTS